MKTLSTLLLALLAAASLQAAPKKLLVVTTTTGFRHSSIANGEKVLTQLGADSGAFTVDFIHQPTGKPGGLKKDANADEKAAQQAAEAKWEEDLKQALQKLSPESLKNYDGVVFFNTTGDLPIPDKDGLLAWIKAGHAFIGMHAASDTFHHWPEFIDMLGGEFKTHGAQVGIECLNVEPKHPANQAVGKSWVILQEEVYQIKNYDTTKVHDLLVLDKHPNDKTPGHHPVSWCKEYGQGKVFYTTLGHREDVIDADPGLKDRKNPVETSLAYQKHILGGIQWALGLKSEKVE